MSDVTEEQEKVRGKVLEAIGEFIRVMEKNDLMGAGFIKIEQSHIAIPFKPEHRIAWIEALHQ